MTEHTKQCVALLDMLANACISDGENFDCPMYDAADVLIAACVYLLTGNSHNFYLESSVARLERNPTYKYITKE